MDILAKYVTNHLSDDFQISINILTPPTPDNTLLKWEGLFEHPDFYLPGDMNNSDDDAKITGELKSFMESVLQDSKASIRHIESATKAKEAWQAYGNTSRIAEEARESERRTFADQVSDHIAQVASASTFPGWSSSAQDVLTLLKNPERNSQQITQRINSLCQSSWVFTAILQGSATLQNSATAAKSPVANNPGAESPDKKKDSKPPKPLTFRGAIHCEAAIASLIAQKAFITDANGKKSTLEVSYYFYILCYYVS